jgi:hypothetical protein
MVCADYRSMIEKLGWRTWPLEAPALRIPNNCSSVWTAAKGVDWVGGAAVARQSNALLVLQ